MFEEGGRFAAFRAAVLLQPPTSGPAAGFCPWLGQQMTLFRHEVASVALADGQMGASGTANHAQATRLFQG